MRRVILDARLEAADNASADLRMRSVLQPLMAAWQSLRDGPNSSDRLDYIWFLDPRAAADVTHYLTSSAERDAPHGELAASWPPLTPDFHSLALEGGRLQLLLIPGNLRRHLSELIAEVDEFHLSRQQLDSLQDVASPPRTLIRAFKALARMAAPGALLSVTDARDIPHDCWTAAGFEPMESSDESVCRARYAPRFVARRAPSRGAVRPGAAGPHAIVIGAGLAGCSTAWALARQGWSCTLLDRRHAIAAETSGNRAGLFHGVLNASDGHHARFNRAAALALGPIVQAALASGDVKGEMKGAARLETGMVDHATMTALLDALGLPPTYVQALDPDEASRRCGLRLSETAWWYPQGGWIDPAGLCRFYLQAAGPRVQWTGGVEVARLRRADEPGSPWVALDARGREIARASAVVLASAHDAARLLRASQREPSTGPWLGTHLESVRGQVSELPAGTPGLKAPIAPLAGHGYALPPVDGWVMAGATTAEGDGDPTLRAADHELNIERYNRLTRSSVDPAQVTMRGRVGWRCASPDRLPLIGALPLEPAERLRTGGRADQPRLMARTPGLFMFCALGSRGITTSALGARLLASWMTGSPFPLPATLVDACDPARFLVRAARAHPAEPAGDKTETRTIP